MEFITGHFRDIVFLTVLILLSGFFSASELALFSLTHAKVRNLVNKGSSGARLIEKMKNKPQELLIVILIGNNVVNILAAALATSISIEAFGSIGVGIATGTMTFLILLFGEIIPKSFAAANSHKIALIIIRPLFVMYVILWPLVSIFATVTRFLTRKHRSKKISEDEIRAATAIGFEAGVVEKDEKEMIEKVFRLNDISAKDIMVPLKKAFILSSSETAENALEKLSKAGFSRAPVSGKNENHIIGVIHVRDLIRIIHKEKGILLSSVMKHPFFFPSEEKIDYLLGQFQERKQHLAVLKGHHGEPEGVITLEDVLEELVGDIRDESGK